MLAEPEESKGTFSYAAPDRVRWEYTSPNPISVVIHGDEMTTWYRDLNRADKLQGRPLLEPGLQVPGRQAARWRRSSSTSPSTSTLPARGASPSGCELDPRFARIEKRLKADGPSGSTTRPTCRCGLRYVEADGDSPSTQFQRRQDERADPGRPLRARAARGRRGAGDRRPRDARPGGLATGSRSSRPRGAARRGRLTTPHGVVETPAFMPVGTLGAVKGVAPAGAGGGRRRRSCSPTSTTWRCAPAIETIERAGRPPRLHRLGAADPDRQRRLPGVQPRRAAQGGRRRRHLPQPPRRRAAALHARGRWSSCRSGWASTSPWCSTSARPGRSTRGARRRLAAHPGLGAAGARAPRRRAAAALFGIVQGSVYPRPARARGGGARGARLRRLRHRRRQRRRAGGRARGGGRVDGAAPARRAAALPDGRGLPRRTSCHAVAPGGRPLRLRAAGAQRPPRRALHPRRACSRSRTPASATTRGRSIPECGCPACARRLARLPAPPDPRRRAHRGGARDPPQPALLP